MERDNVIFNLCYYDSRNPLYDGTKMGYREKECYCDNCFYGRHELANELLKYIDYESTNKTP